MSKPTSQGVAVRISKDWVTDPAHAESYYVSNLRQDYYEGKGTGIESPGTWEGIGAAMLGLHVLGKDLEAPAAAGLPGEVTSEDFSALAKNRNPATGERLTVRMKKNRRVGIDISFHDPDKRISVYEAITGDERVAQAREYATARAMAEIEKRIATRYKVDVTGRDGKKKQTTRLRVTGNAVWAAFEHSTSRPVDGYPDPHGHGHRFLFNATYDPKEERWKGLDLSHVYRDLPKIQDYFRAEYAARLTELGLPVETTVKGFTIAGLPETLVPKFSRRAAQIEQAASRKGITDPKRLDGLGAQIRGSKTDTPYETLRRIWDGKLQDGERRAIWGVREGRFHDPARVRISAEEALERALAHHFERESAVAVDHVLQTAGRFGLGSVGPTEIKDALRARQDLIYGSVIIRRGRRRGESERMITSRSLLADERAVVAFARESRGTVPPLAPDAAAFRFADPLLAKDSDRSRDQRGAVRHILGSEDGVIIVRGLAGTGKTTALKEAARGIRAAGRGVFAFAPGAEQARGTLRSEGFPQADTIARLLVDVGMQEKLRGNVMMIDEAGQVGMATMGRLFEIAKAQGARVVLIGDKGQHGPVEAGDALRRLEDSGAVRPYTLGRIQRQRTAEYREVAYDLAHGRTDEGLAKLESMGNLHEVRDAGERSGLVAGRLADLAGAGSSVIVIAPTHREGEQITAAVREELRAREYLHGSDRALLQLKDTRWTDAEKGDFSGYRPGQWVSFHQNVSSAAVANALTRWGGEGFATQRPSEHTQQAGTRQAGAREAGIRQAGIRRGERFEVIATTERGGVMMRGADGRVLALPLNRAKNYTVAEGRKIQVAAGDTIKLTKGGRTLEGSELRNGARYLVTGFDDEGNLRLKNGQTIRADFGHLAYGYVETSFAKQSTSADFVLVAQDSKSGRAASREQVYVSATRGKWGAEIFTDDKAWLRETVRESAERVSAGAVAKAAETSARKPSREDPRVADPRVADPRIPDPRIPDPRMLNPRVNPDRKDRKRHAAGMVRQWDAMAATGAEMPAWYHAMKGQRIQMRGRERSKQYQPEQE